MSEPVKNTSTTDNSDRTFDGRRKSNLGLSRGIYATGNSVKDGLISFIVITVAIIAAIGFGKAREIKTEKANIFSKLAEYIDTWHNDSKAFFKEQFAKIAPKNKGNLPKITGAEVGAAVVAATVLSHVVQIPGFHKGWVDAQNATDRYDALESEKEKLVVANARLIEENSKFRGALEKKSGSFTERASAEPETSAAGVSATR